MFVLDIKRHFFCAMSNSQMLGLANDILQSFSGWRSSNKSPILFYVIVRNSAQQCLIMQVVFRFYLAYLCYQFAQFFFLLFYRPFARTIGCEQKAQTCKGSVGMHPNGQERKKEGKQKAAKKREREKSGFKWSVKRSTQCCVHGAERL